MMILGVMYVMVSSVTITALLVGISYGFFNASWFMYSRAQDYEADKAMGKITTIVSFGLDATPELAIMYLFVGFVFSLFAAAYMPLAAGILLIVTYMAPSMCYTIYITTTENYLTPNVCAKLRVQGIKYTIIYGVLASTTIIFEGLL